MAAARKVTSCVCEAYFDSCSGFSSRSLRVPRIDDNAEYPEHNASEVPDCGLPLMSLLISSSRSPNYSTGSLSNTILAALISSFICIEAAAVLITAKFAILSPYLRTCVARRSRQRCLAVQYTCLPVSSSFTLGTVAIVSAIFTSASSAAFSSRTILLGSSEVPRQKLLLEPIPLEEKAQCETKLYAISNDMEAESLICNYIEGHL